MSEENITQEFRLKNIDKTRNYFITETNQNELMSKKHKKVCRSLNYTEHFLILISAVTGCVSVFAFVFFVGIPDCKFCKRIKNLCSNCKNQNV